MLGIPESIPTGLTTVLSVLVLLPIVYYVYLAAVYVRKVKAIGKIVDQLPGPEKHWLYGNLHQVGLTNFKKALRKGVIMLFCYYKPDCFIMDYQHPGANEEGVAWMAKQLGKNTCMRLWFGPLRCNVAVAHPSTVKPILRSSEPKQLSGIYGMVKSWLGDGLLLSSGSKWFRNRRLLTPAFHFDVLKPYMKVYNEAANIFMDKLEKTSKSGSVEISRPITLLTLNVILRCAFSSEMDVQRQGKSHPYVQAVIELATLLVKRVFNPLMHIDLFYSLSRDGRLSKKYLKVVHDVSETVIAKRKITLKENPDEGKKRYLDFLDILLLARDENDEGLTDREIRDEVDTFLFEGHDTTASSILWVLYEIARNTNYQQRCREEIDLFLENREVRDVEWDDLTEMPFTTQCIKEAMRIHSPVPYIARELTKELELDGVKLPPGTFVDIVIYLCHHNEDVWGADHNEFRPERFDPDRKDEMDSFAYVPFSAGPRNCIGQNFAMHEIKVVVVKMVNRFFLTLDPAHPIERKPELVTRAAHGIKLFLKPRH